MEVFVCWFAFAWFTVIVTSQYQFVFDATESPTESTLQFNLPGLNKIKKPSFQVKSPIHDAPAAPGFTIGNSKEIFHRCGALIRKIEVTLNKGKQAEQNLTALRNIVHAELVKETREREKTGLTLRLNKIENLLTELHDRNTNSEVRFRTFMRQVSAGAIRSPSYAHSVLENLHRTYTLEVDAHLTAVRNVLGDAVAFLKSAVRNAGMLLGELARIKLNFFTGLFHPARKTSVLHFLG